jgi:hypothetical protein
MIRRCSWVCGHGQGLRRDTRKELHKLKCLHPRRTTEMMRAVYEVAQDPNLSRTAKEKHLRSFGMHDKRVSEWIMDVKASH